MLGVSGSAPLAHVVQVAAGDESSYALLADGTVVAWGGNNVGQLGNPAAPSPSLRPVRVVSTSGTGVLRGVVAVAAGGGFALALLSNHTVVAWGFGTDGELGNGSTSSSAVPVVVHGVSGPMLTGIVAVSVGAGTSYAVSSAGSVFAWGFDGHGALGDNDPQNRSTPVVVAGVGAVGALSHVVGVSAGDNWAMALLSNGTVVSWGLDAAGELGIGSTADSSVPVPVSALGDHITSIGTGSRSGTGFAVDANGAVFGWGFNGYGQLGDGSMTTQTSPVRVVTLGAGSGVAQLSGGYSHSVAVTGAGVTYVWGDNAGYQLGDGSTVRSSTPTQPYALGKVGLPKLFLLTAPVLAGRAQVGSTLTVTAGTWGLPATAHAYQWLRDGRAIKGATKAGYRLVAADRRHRVCVVVAAARAGYPANATTTRAVVIAR